MAQRSNILVDGEFLAGLDLGVIVFGAVDGGADFEFLDLNSAVERFEGVDRGALVGVRLSKAFPGVEEMGLLALMRRVWQTGTAATLPATEYVDHSRRDWRQNHVRRLPDGRVLVLYEDLTRQKRAELAAEDERTRYRLLTEASLDGVWDWNLAEGALYLSPAWKAQIGYTDDEVPNTLDSWRDRLHSDDQARVLDQLQRYLAAPEGLWLAEFRLQHKAGHYIWVQARGTPVRGPSGAIERILGVHIDVTARRAADAHSAALREALALHARVVSTTQDLMAYVDRGYVYRVVNDAYLAMAGLARDEIVGRPVAEVVGADVFDRLVRPTLERALAGETVAYQAPFEYAIGRRHMDVRYEPDRGDDGAVLGVVVTERDITALHAAQRGLEQAAMVFKSTAEAVSITDAQGVIQDVNDAFTAITGYSKGEAVGSTHRLLRSGRHDDDFYKQMWLALRVKGQWRGEVWNRRRDGTSYPQTLVISALRDGEGTITGYVGVGADISVAKRAEAHLEFLAHHDPLTELPNRLLLGARLEQSLAKARRAKRQLAVAFMDLDRFKHINDSLGHATGDAVLRQVAERLQRVVREADTVARISGDEFVVVLDDVDGLAGAMQAARRLMGSFDSSFDLAGRQLALSGSLGLALFPDDGATAEALLRNADAAMYAAKEAGPNTWRFYAEDCTELATEQLFLQSALRQALQLGQLHLVYQPQVELATGRIIGVEALARWRHPERGLIPPGRFIPAAEQGGSIHRLGRWALEQACAQAVVWRARGWAGRVAVNVSPLQLRAPDFVELVQQALGRSGLPPSAIELEVTESALMRQLDASMPQLERLAALGVPLAVDDFGTGYSSLSYLTRLPVQRIKLDRCFVADLPGDQHGRAIAEAVLGIGRAMDLIVIAEGVETQGQAQCLDTLGCAEVQGYLFGRPKRAAEVTLRAGPIGDRRRSERR